MEKLFFCRHIDSCGKSNNCLKDIGKHVSNIISMEQDEKIIGAMPVYNFDEDKERFTKLSEL